MSTSTKNNSGLGINLSNIRPRNTTINAQPPTGFSGLVNFDAASMYPTMASSNNRVYDINNKSYHVSPHYPFEVKRLSMSELFAEGNEWLSSKSYERRYDAEKASLEELCKWSDGDWEQDLRNKKKLETFDVDHPEWLI
jgi:hypothetical protein